MKYKITKTLTPGSITLGLALMLTTLCHGQSSFQGPPHNVIYWDGYSGNNQSILQSLASSAYTDVIVGFLTPDQNCNLGPNGNLAGDIQNSIQTLHNAGKTVLVSFGGQEDVVNKVDITSQGYQACYMDMLAHVQDGGPSSLVQQLQGVVGANGFDGVDIDFEDDSGFNNAYDGVDFLMRLTYDLYIGLPQWQNIVTHAPQTTYWTQTSAGYPNPPYAQLWQNLTSQSITNAIAWFNLQTYNNCEDGTDSPRPNGVDCTAQAKINDYVNIVNGLGIPPIKVVVGVPVASCGTVDDSGNCNGDGYIPYQDPSGNGNDMNTLIAALQQQFPSQFGGVMGWDYTWDLQYDYGLWSQNMSQALTTNQANYVTFNTQTLLCLDSNYNAFSANVYTDSCNTGNYQNWQFKGNTVVDALTGLCLDSNYAGNVYTDSCNTGNYQNWWFFNGVIFDRQTRLCLQDNNGSVITAACDPNNVSQGWWAK